MAASLHRSLTSISTAAAFSARRLASAASAATNHGVIIIGSCGALGTAVSREFAAAGWNTFGVDIRKEQPTQASYSLTSVKQNPQGLHAGDGDAYARRTEEALDAIGTWQRRTGSATRMIVCTAGGWMGGSIADLAIFGQIDSMLHMCAWPVLMAGHIGAHTLPAQRGDSGRNLIAVVGSAAALGPTPGMLAYGASKAMAHFITRSMGEPSSGLPDGTLVYAALPTTLDTPANRAGMPTADKSTWVHPAHLAQAFLAQGSAAVGQQAPHALHASVPLLPASGSSYVVKQVGASMVWESADQ